MNWYILVKNLRITYILKIHFFLLFAGYDKTTKVRNLLV